VNFKINVFIVQERREERKRGERELGTQREDLSQRIGWF